MEIGEVAQGRLREVSLNRVGTELNGDHLSGATVLNLYDVSDFDEEGGAVDLEKLDATLQSYSYTSVDYDNNTITLSSGLTQDYGTDEKVYPYPEEYEKIAKVLLEGDEEWIDAIVAHDLDDKLEDNIYEGVDEKQVLVQLMENEGGPGGQAEWWLTEITNERARISGSAIDPVGAPGGLPTEAPEVTPPIESVTGLSTGLAIRVGEPEPGALLEYHISTTPGFTVTPGNPATLLAGTPTASRIYIAVALPDGSKPLPEVNYYIRVLAVNNIGAAPSPSPEVQGQLDPAGVMTLIAAELAVGFILTGRIQVGVAYIDANEGIVLPQPDGSVTRFTVDGLTPNKISGNAVLMALTLTETASLYGTTTTFGTQVLAQGVLDPTDPPGLSTDWESQALSFPVGVVPGNMFGLCEKIGDSTKWITTYCSQFSTNMLGIYQIDKATGVATAVTIGGSWASTQNTVGGICSDGTNYWVLGVKSNNQYCLRKLNSSFDSVGSLDIFAATIPKRPGLGLVDGVPWVVYTPSSGAGIRIRQYTEADTPAYFGTYDPHASAAARDYASVHGEWSSDYADFLDPRIIISSNDVSQDHLAYDWDGVTRITNHDWDKAAICRGIYWDGTRFIQIDDTGKIWKYSDGHAGGGTATVYAKYSWLDDNPTGGTHETGPSPIAQIVRPARKRVVVSCTDAPEVGLPGDDRAKKIIVYAATNTTTVRAISALAEGVVSLALENIGTSGSLPKAANEFTSGGIANPGSFRSGATDAGGPLVSLSGADIAQRVGPYMWDSASKADTGWVNFSPGAGAAPFASATVVVAQYRRIGQFCMVRLSKNNTATRDTSGSTTGNFGNVDVIGTGLPAAVCPAIGVEGSGRFDDTPVTCVLATDGSVVWTGGYPRNYSATGVPFTVTFFYMV